MKKLKICTACRPTQDLFVQLALPPEFFFPNYFYEKKMFFGTSRSDSRVVAIHFTDSNNDCITCKIYVMRSAPSVVRISKMDRYNTGSRSTSAEKHLFSHENN